MKIFTIYDEKAQAYLAPFHFQNIGEANRAMCDLLADDQHPFSRHAEDYTLYSIGEYDNLTAELTSDKQLIKTMLELRAQIQEEKTDAST